MIIVGLDLSLTKTGVAHLLVADGKQPEVALETIESKAGPVRHNEKGEALMPSLGARRYRLDGLRARIVRACQGADVVAIEGPSFASKGGQHHDRSGLAWLVIDTLFAEGFTVVEVPPNNLKMYATGKGNASKDAVMLAIANRYRDLVEVTGNDVADALGIAALTARYLQHPIEPSMPQTHLRAIATVAWPPGMELL